ncbi:transglutaminase family protein [Microbacterium sp.]|uniref:transglutaminase family protein n=1 Tax=Microbacterium sp. TaxID=51671 RepID=UPI002812103E|nr:DUF3488 and transglutaminase-like domain-containing protein [Microbacterium sp.]
MADPNRARGGERSGDTTAPPVLPSALAAAAMLVAMWPYTAVIQPGAWSLVVVTMIIVVGLGGVLGRAFLRHRRAATREALTLGIQTAVVICASTALFGRDTGMFGLVPTPTTVRLIGVHLSQSAEEIANGVAPISATESIAALLGISFGVVAVLVDQLLAHRLVVLAVALTTVVGAMPMVVSFGGTNMVWFLLQAIVILVLLRFAARRDDRSPRAASALVAAGVGVVAVAVSLAVVPGLPVSATLPGSGAPLTVSADLRLGDDLRRPEGVEVMTLVTSAAAPPYLRLATLSRFDGEVWRPDRGSQQPLRDGFGPPDWDAAVKTSEHEVSIRVLGVSSERLPVPYAAEAIAGLSGRWRAMPLNRTVLTSTADANGADYTVTVTSVSPTLEQIRATTASGPVDRPEPADDLPPIITETAREVTADATNDYDRLIALQSWFRQEFTYSLEAPVQEGFDGTGADAVATFLEERTGYCIHFAGAFALMVQSLDMPVRIVVGYLPGTATDEKRGDDTVYSISSDQLHSWPEVYFDGIGWVPFEPTATLGVPTEFASASAGGGTSGDPEAPTPTTAPTDGPSAGPTSSTDPRFEEDAGGGTALRTLDPTPVMLFTLGVLLVALLPGLFRELRRLVRRRRAAAGDALAAWRELTDSMTDLGVPADPSHTARMRGAALARERGVREEPLRVLVAAVERAGYAADGGRADAVPRGDRADVRRPLDAVLADLRAASPASARLRAALLPASLVRAPITDRARTTV